MSEFPLPHISPEITLRENFETLQRYLAELQTIVDHLERKLSADDQSTDSSDR